MQPAADIGASCAPSLAATALKQALTKVHHRMALAMPANHRASTWFQCLQWLSTSVWKIVYTCSQLAAELLIKIVLYCCMQQGCLQQLRPSYTVLTLPISTVK